MAEPTIVLYENATAPVPAVIRGPVSVAITAPFVDQEDALVTFTVAVPLEVVTSGVEALTEFTNGISAEPSIPAIRLPAQPHCRPERSPVGLVLPWALDKQPLAILCDVVALNPAAFWGGPA